MYTPSTCALDMRINNSPSALPRLLLAFSRRRLRIREMTVDDSVNGEPARLHLVFECNAVVGADGLESFVRQLRRMVEVVVVEQAGAVAAPGRAAA